MKKLLLLSLLVLNLAVACDTTEEDRNAFMTAATGLEQSGKFAEARDRAQKALELDPKYGQAYLLVARCYMEEKNNDEAIRNYVRAHELMPDNLEALENLARLNLVKGDLAKADEYASKAAVLSPSSVEVKVVKAGVHMRRQEYDQAAPLLEDILKTAPANEEAVIGLATIAINSNKPDEARAILEKAVKESQSPSPAVLSMLANIALDKNDMAAAEGYIKQILDHSQGDEQLILQLAAIYQATKREKEIPSLLNAFLEKTPDALTVRTRLAEFHVSQGNYEEALKVVDAAPVKTPRVRLLRAGLLTQSGKVEQSIPMLREIIADSAADAETVTAAYMGLASIFVQQNKVDEAEKELNALLERDPKNLQALFMRSGMLFNKRDFPKALADMERVVELAPNDPSAHLGMADVLNAAGDSARAERIISDVIVRFPKYAQAYITMANLQMMQGTPEAALMTLDIGRHAVTGNVDLVMARADILTSLKRYDEARKELEEFGKDNPDLGTALQLRIAEIEMLRERFSAAADVYEKILKENPDIQTAVDGYLHALIAAKKNKEALNFADKRREDRPEDPMASYIYGEIALINRDAAAGEKAFKKALELNPAWEQPLTRLAQLYTAANRISDAIKLCDDLLAKDPKAVSPAVLKGILLEQKGDLDGAEAQYRAVLEMHKDNFLSSNNLAYLLSRHKNSKERLAEAEKLAETATASGASATYDTLGWIQFQVGKYEDAEKNIRKAYADLQDNPTIAYHLAAVLARSEDNKEKLEEAASILEEITKANAPGFPQMSDAKALIRQLKSGQSAKAEQPKKDDAAQKGDKNKKPEQPKKAEQAKKADQPKKDDKTGNTGKTEKSGASGKSGGSGKTGSAGKDGKPAASANKDKKADSDGKPAAGGKKEN